MFCLATFDDPPSTVLSCVSASRFPRCAHTHTRTHTHTHTCAEGNRSARRGQVSFKGVRKERSPTLDIPGDRSGCKFYALAAFSFSTVRAHGCALSKAVHYRPPNQPFELVHLPLNSHALIFFSFFFQGHREKINGKW